MKLRPTSLYLFALCVFTVQSAFAQPRFERKNLPAANIEYTKVFCQTDNVVPGPAGTDIIWDFTTLTPRTNNNPTYLVKVQNAKNFPQSSQFPDANIAFGINDTTIEFINTSKNTLNKTGTVIPSGMIQLTETYDLGPIPIASGGKLKDTYKADLRFTDGRVGRRTGSVELHYDGFGTLLTPSYTIEKTALRLKIIDIYTDSIFVQPRTIVRFTRDTTYRWYGNSSTMALLEYSSGAIAQQQQPLRQYKTVTYIRDTSNTTTSIIDNSNNKDMIIMPQPASDNVIITLNTEQIINQVNISFTDITGRTVMTFPVSINNEFITIPVSALDNGLYMVHIKISDEKILHTKCMIMR